MRKICKVCGCNYADVCCVPEEAVVEEVVEKVEKPKKKATPKKKSAKKA